jgi:hypothetical protein
VALPGRAKVSDVAVSSLASIPIVADAPGSLERFHPAVRLWFERRFPDGPTEAQAGGWPAILAGHHTLICAPTGSGKTLAGFLTAIDALYQAHEAGESIEGATQVVYLSPLKALAVDVHTNLEEPLRQIAEVARELGHEPAPITVALRTGDSTSYERQAMVRRPPNLLVTTPESLYLYLTAERSRATLGTRWRRSSSTRSTLWPATSGARTWPSRSSGSGGDRASAGAHRPLGDGRPVQTAARLLVGAKEPLPTVVDSARRRRLDLSLELPDDRARGRLGEQFGEIIDRIAAHVASTAPPRLRQHAADVGAPGPRAGRAARARAGGRPPRQPVQGPPPARGGPPAGRGPAGPGGHGLARARHRHRAGGARVPGGLAALPSPPSCSGWAAPTTPAPARPRGPLPHDARRAGRVRGAAGRGARRAPRRHFIRPSPPRHPGPADRGRGGQAAEEWPRTSSSNWCAGRALRRARPGPTSTPSSSWCPSASDRPGKAHGLPAPRRVNGVLRPGAGPAWPRSLSGGAIAEVGDYRVIAEPDDTPVGP